MRLDITPHANPLYNCLDVLILTIAKNWNIEHRLMFENAWRFRYARAPAEATSLSFEDALDVRELVERRDIEGALLRHHGLRIDRHPLSDIEQCVRWVRGELASGHPVALGIDAYHCHWSSAYRKYNLEHYCLAIGVNEGTGTFVVLDPYLTKDAVELPFEAYALTLRESLSFRRCEPQLRTPDWQGILRNAASSMEPKTSQMRDLADDLERLLDFDHEVARHADPFASLLVLYFKTLSFSRLNFAEALALLGDLSGQAQVLSAATRMKQQGNEIFKIFLLLMKMSLTPARFEARNIATKLRAVADEEHLLVRDVLRIACRPEPAVTTTSGWDGA
jgi:hypothetical protein